MEVITNPGLVGRVKIEAPQLASVLREMKEGLDVVRSKVEALTAKVKANSYPTADGISYLEAKHLLLLSYCQCLVYYLLRKAKGFSIDGHPVVRSLVEIRMFLEKIRPIDKKLQYQIQKLTTAGGSAAEQALSERKESGAAQKTEDLSNLKPKPDLLAPRFEDEQEDGIYHPRKFAPMAMEEKTSKQERDAARKDKHFLRQATGDSYMKDVLDDLEDRPEEIRELFGESREERKYIAQYERQQEVEEDLFTRATRTKEDKRREKRLKLRSGLDGLTENFNDEFKFLDNDDDQPGSFSGSGRNRGGGFKKRKRRH
uniref:Neuroguidin n=1 Tax=Noccaea caerulescens TaxID=107243 RepID=A0A1J3CTT8_NOCCA